LLKFSLYTLTWRSVCLLLPNTISCVFNEENSCHDEFKPVYQWILKRNGKMVYGGKGYMDELKKMPNCLNFITRLNSMGKTVSLDDDEVDEYWNKIRTQRVLT
jgi:hypothetical protein